MSYRMRNAKVPTQGRIQGRFFLVGCPRSGTTLLQSLLAAHPRIASFPESHFFWSLVPNRPALRAAGFALRRARPRFQAYVKQLGRAELRWRLARRARLMRQFVKAYVGILDDLTLEQHKLKWVDKTPENLHYADVIERYVPGARFIHIVRNGPDVVASLYDVTRVHARRWHGPWGVDACIHRWNQDVDMTRRLVERRNHIAVRYEDLVAEPEQVLKELCAFLDVVYLREMIELAGQAAHALIRKDELWKSHVTAGIAASGKCKFDSLFDEQHKAYIRERLSNLNGLGSRKPAPNGCAG
jgi:hypothetical protein